MFLIDMNLQGFIVHHKYCIEAQTTPHDKQITTYRGFYCIIILVTRMARAF